jgi:hypothetical protein
VEGQAGMKLQISYDYLKQQVETLTAQADLEPDQSFADRLDKLPVGSLSIFDLGYCTLERLKRLMPQHYFVTRLLDKVHLYWPGTTQPLPLVAELMKRGAGVAGVVVELAVEVGQKEHLPLRLVAQSLPEAAYVKRLAKAEAACRRKGRELSPERANRLRWNLYLTNVAETVLSGVEVGLVYRLRWQIELLFKLWKSGLGLEQTQNKKLGRVWCEIYARLIGYTLLIYLSWGIGWAEDEEEVETIELVAAEEQLEAINSALQSGKITVRECRELKKERKVVKQALERQEQELSLPKALQTFREELKKLGEALSKGKPKQLKQVIEKLRKRWECYCLKEWRTDRVSSYGQVRQVRLNPKDRGLEKEGLIKAS